MPSISFHIVCALIEIPNSRYVILMSIHVANVTKTVRSEEQKHVNKTYQNILPTSIVKIYMIVGTSICIVILSFECVQVDA